MEATRADKLVGMNITQRQERGLPSKSKEFSTKAIEIINRYGHYDKFLCTFHPLKIAAYTRDEMRCHTGTAPTLFWLCKAYGNEGCNGWVKVMLNVLINKQPSSDKAPSAEQEDSIADWIITSCGWLKATELMLFVKNYGTYCDTPVYSVNELNIKAQMRGFMKRRAARLAEAEYQENALRAKEYQQRIRDGHTMNYEQWQEYKRAHLQNETTDDDDRKRT